MQEMTDASGWTTAAAWQQRAEELLRELNEAQLKLASWKTRALASEARLSAVGIALGDDATGPQMGAPTTGPQMGLAPSHQTSASSGTFLGGDAPPGYSLQATNQAPPAPPAPTSPALAPSPDLAAFYQYHNILQNNDGTIEVPGLGTRRALPRKIWEPKWEQWKAERGL